MDKRDIKFPEQIAYLCDPKKAKDCDKRVCYKNPMYDGKHGYCKYTPLKTHSKDGKQYAYNSKHGKWEEVI